MLVGLTSAFGFASSGPKIASGDFFSETPNCARENDAGARFLCRINGWLNYDSTSGYVVAFKDMADEGWIDNIDDHHIATDKSIKGSPYSGGPWTPKFEKLFERAGLSLQDEANRLKLPFHQGPHPEKYHEFIFERLNQAVRSKNGRVLKGDSYRDALLKELNNLKSEVATPGTLLNSLTTKDFL